MTFQLTIHDREGTQLNIGDIVMVSNRNEFTFYSEVKWIEERQVLAPFHTFSFHSFLKVDKVPDHAIKGNNPDYDIWYLEIPEVDDNAAEFSEYLSSWRECERQIEKAAFRIKLLKSPITETQMTLFS